MVINAAPWIAGISRNICLLALVIVIGTALLEFSSRWLLPISPASSYMDANDIRINVFEGSDRFMPGVWFRQVSHEFDAPVQIGANGYREPAAAFPDLIFLGDSFTFGQGLRDEQTFAAIYCRTVGLSCVNLGFPGTGTSRQIGILERELERNAWQPKAVKLFIMAMSTSLMAGNDFVDTAQETATDATEELLGTKPPSTALGASNSGVIEWIVERRQRLLASSNLVRVAYAHLGPLLRAWFSPSAPKSTLEAGVAAVSDQLNRLEALSHLHDFSVTIYILHPVQDILRGTYAETEDAVRTAAGHLPVVPTANSLLEDPKSHYFSYDGHFNAAGARRIAELLLQEWKNQGATWTANPANSR